MTTKVIVIPDVHGRTFWKDAITKYKDFIDNQLVDVVFLGDYLDPYRFEKVTVTGSISNFKEIIEYAKRRTNVHLLIGNHDMHYFDKFYADNIRKVRYIQSHSKEIISLFNANKNLFKIAWETKVNDKKFLFTHAGVLKTWAEVHMGKLRVRHGCIEDKYKVETIEPTAESLNSLLDSKNGLIALGAVSERRGGWEAYGSVIWADFEEHLDSTRWNPPGRDELCNYCDEVYQVFAHSLGWPFNTMESLDMCYIGPYFAMLDARTSFLIEDDGSIHEINDNYQLFRKEKEVFEPKREHA